MRDYVVVCTAAAVGLLAGLVPQVSYRWTVPAGAPLRADCGRCGRSFPQGWRGWIGSGRCPACRGSVGGPWWAFALLGAALCAVLAWRLASSSVGVGLLVAAWLVFLLGGMVLATVDVAVHRLPTALVYATAAGSGGLLAVAALAAGRPDPLVGGLLGAAAVGGVYLLMAVVAGTQIGLGDVRLAAVAGLLLGTVGWSAVVLGTLLPFLFALPLAVIRAVMTGNGATVEHRRYLAFGPFLIAGAVAAVVLVR
jgi:leader peptidase (prepilin peptidase) / N-methyltransferase